MSDPAQVEVLRHSLEAIAEEMGEVLQRGAFSPNIKERRDHSCALFTPEAKLLAQAEHIPVHLGAMPLAVTAVLDALGPLSPGDVALVNDPYQGGTHLPDLTMIAPVHHDAEPVGYVTARAHHADVGGRSPGSMPAGATHLLEEGLVIPPVHLRRGGELVDDVHELILANTRSPTERRGDLSAQQGALVIGIQRFQALAARMGHQTLTTASQALIDRTEALTRARLATARPATSRAKAVLEDDGTGTQRTLRVEATIAEHGISLDYAGTDPQGPGNLNAPRPVTLAGALYVLRCLLGADVPSNAGLMRVLEVRIPEGTVLNPHPGGAVAGGNVETSQRNVDLLFDALAHAFPDRVPAQSQGTMNNLTLGTTQPGHAFTSYETLGGGEGGGPGGPGRSGIHTHMTNTQNTPVEAFEQAYPLRVRATTLRRASGGSGAHPGGDGIRREMEALIDGIEVHLITSRRTTQPAGLAGGGPGASGRNAVERASGAIEELGAVASTVLDRGDVLIVETPGGGGWGREESSEA